ncbi:hypothetical protein SAMN05216294_3105 [Flagellimonas zhangzhouensis]|uniref:PrcB C-terminal n=1 Tax=Flagellimonas zhangzhouensis TaxID=1073328 RepID=A0A1H2YPY3_9FLAO|nr:hypothetical protein SAMN05216294_3105 [Allomuricauda zhangzhouensis]SDX07236.1 hypothetical protein SAMN04487892_3158 [Allomuricauda zhangzhouensis]
MRSFGFLLMILVFSCKAQKEPQNKTGDEIENFALLAHDDYSNISEYQTQIIRDQKSLQKFYSQVNKTRKPGLPVPMVDFSKDMLILVCLGEQHSHKNVVISKAKESNEEIVLKVKVLEETAQGDISIQPMYYPFYLYKMPLVDKNFTLQNIE